MKGIDIEIWKHRVQNLSRKTLGILLLLLVVFIWVMSSIVMQFLYIEEEMDPLVLTTFNTSLFSLWLASFLWDGILYLWRKRSPLTPPNQRNPTINEEDPEIDTTPIAEVEVDKLGVRGEFLSALAFAPVWFLANYTFNAAHLYTSVSSVIIISSTSGLFTLVLGFLARVDNLSIVKLFAVTLSIIGVSMVSYADVKGEEEKDYDNPLLGNGLAFLGAFFYGAYAVLLKRLLGSEDRLNMGHFFGFVGIITIIVLWPLIGMLRIFSLIHIAFTTLTTIGLLLLNGVVGTVISDYIWLWAILLTSPLIGTLGLSLTIPLAMLADVVMGKRGFTILYVCGTLLVIGGFLFVNLEDRIDSIRVRMGIPTVKEVSLGVWYRIFRPIPS